MIDCRIKKGIARSCRNNAGGVNYFYIANFDDILGYKYNADNVISVIEMKPGKEFYKFFPNKNSSSAVENIQTSIENGTVGYEQVITMVFGKMQADKREQIVNLGAGNFVVIANDRNKRNWVYGINDSMELTGGNSSTGSVLADLNGYTLTFTSMEGKLAVEASTDSINPPVVPADEPKFIVTLADGETEFSFETDGGLEFTVEQGDVTNTYTGAGTTPVIVTGLSSSIPFTMVLDSGTTYFKYLDDKLQDILIDQIGIIETLEHSFQMLTKLKQFRCTADLSSVTNFNTTWYMNEGLTNFPAIDTSSGTDFTNTFRDCLNLECLTEINTTSGTLMTNMFKGCNAILQPDSANIALIESAGGFDWTNAGTCI